MKQNKFNMEWDAENGITTCILTSDIGNFIGVARCHPDDTDMMSEKVGGEIACCRAAINALKHERDCIIKPSLKALKQLQYSMKHSTKFNPKSYENKMLRRQIENWELDLNVVNDMINTEKETLKQYINTKEELYQKLRSGRKNGQN